MDDLETIKSLKLKVEHYELLLHAVSLGLSKTIDRQEWQIKQLNEQIEILKDVLEDENIKVGGTEQD